MPEVALDSSVFNRLGFPPRWGTRCLSARAPDRRPGCVLTGTLIFEVARGFLRSLIALHNYSLEFQSFADLHQAAHSGQQRFKPHSMHTWLGAFDDYFATLGAEDGDASESLKLELTFWR